MEVARLLEAAARGQEQPEVGPDLDRAASTCLDALGL